MSSSCWDVKDLVISSAGYKSLAVLLCDDLRYTKILMDVTKSEEVDEVSHSMVHISDVMGRSMPLMRMMTQAEFEKNSSVSTIFRLQSLASRTMGAFVKQVGQQYLRLVIGEMVENLLDTDLAVPMELDPSKVVPQRGLSLEAAVAENRDKLIAVTQRIYDRITDPAMVQIMPRGIRAACYFISSVCDQYQDKFTPDDKTKLVGGFIMLRFFNPALLTPEAHNLLPPGRSPSPPARRNLVLITKVLQNLSNNVQFGQKELWMSCMNVFLKANARRMSAYLEELPNDPKKQPGQQPWSDVDSTNNIRLEEPKDLSAFNLKHFLVLHRVTLKNREALVTGINKLSRFPGQTNSEVDIEKVLSHLGSDPKFKIGKSSSDQQAQMLGKTLLVSFDVRIGRIYTSAPVLTGEPTKKEWDELSFLYPGNPTKDNVPVVYFVLRRFNYEFLRFSSSLSEFIAGVCAEAVQNAKIAAEKRGNTSGGTSSSSTHLFAPAPSTPRASVSSTASALLPFRSAAASMADSRISLPAPNGRLNQHRRSHSMGTPGQVASMVDAGPLKGLGGLASSGDNELMVLDVVVDLSFSGLPDDLVRPLLSQLRNLLRVLPKNVQIRNMIVVNPSPLFFVVMHALAPQPNFQVEELYSPKYLKDYIPDPLMPEESKYFFPNCFSVYMTSKKANQPAKQRAIKVTPWSVLEIDTRTNTLKGDYPLTNLDLINTTDSNSVSLSFVNPSVVLSFDLTSSEQHSSLVNAILQNCIALQSLKPSQRNFMVTKINRAKKKQQRTIMVLRDCLLNTKKDIIKGVIPFISLGTVEPDGENEVCLKFKGVIDDKIRGERLLIFKDKEEASLFVMQVLRGIETESSLITNLRDSLSSQLRSLTFRGVLRAVLVAKVIWLARARARIREKNRLKDQEAGRLQSVDKISNQLSGILVTPPALPPARPPPLNQQPQHHHQSEPLMFAVPPPLPHQHHTTTNAHTNTNQHSVHHSQHHHHNNNENRSQQTQPHHSANKPVLGNVFSYHVVAGDSDDEDSDDEGSNKGGGSDSDDTGGTRVYPPPFSNSQV